MSIEQIKAMRQQKEVHFAGVQSPLLPEQREKFTGFNYFPINLDLRFEVAITPFDNETHIPLPMNNGSDGPQVKKVGKVTVAIEGEAMQFTVLDMSGQGMGFHFKDSTNSEETYSAGRFVPVIPLDDGLYLVDFNLAGNLMCAYADNWTCPIPLKENCVDVPIRAGEILPDEVWVQH